MRCAASKQIACCLAEFKSYAVVGMDSVHLFVDSGKLTAEVRSHLATDNCQQPTECVM